MQLLLYEINDYMHIQRTRVVGDAWPLKRIRPTRRED